MPRQDLLHVVVSSNGGTIERSVVDLETYRSLGKHVQNTCFSDIIIAESYITHAGVASRIDPPMRTVALRRARHWTCGQVHVSSGVATTVLMMLLCVGKDCEQLRDGMGEWLTT